MAVLSLAYLLKLTNDPLESGIAENIITTDHLIGTLPFESIGSRDSISVKREKALPAVTKAASGATITASALLDFSRVPTYVRRYIVDQEPDILDAGAADGIANVRALAIGAASKAIARTYGDDLINGHANFTTTAHGTGGWTTPVLTCGPGHDAARGGTATIRYTHSGTLVAYRAPGDKDFGATQTISSGQRLLSASEGLWATFTYAGAPSANADLEFTLSGGDLDVDGLMQLCPQDSSNGQWIDSTGADGDSLTLSSLDQLADLVKDANGPKVYIMPAVLRRKLVALLRAAGLSQSDLYMSDYFPQLSSGPQRVLTYNGLPVLVSDYIPLTMTKGGSGATLTAAFCATLGAEAGLCGIYSTASADVEDKVLFSGANGIVAVDLGTSQTADTRKIRVKSYWGLKNKTAKGLAMLDNLKQT